MALGEERATGDRPPVPSHGLVPPPLLHADACFPVGLGRLPFYRRLCLASIILQLIKIGVYLLHPRRAPALSTTGPGSDFGGIPAPHITGDARGMRPLWSAAERCRGELSGIVHVSEGTMRTTGPGLSFPPFGPLNLSPSVLQLGLPRPSPVCYISGHRSPRTPLPLVLGCLAAPPLACPVA